MKTLTAKEEEIMGFFWEKGPMFVKQLLELYPEPRPHFNTYLPLSVDWKKRGICLIRLSVTPISIMLWYRRRISAERRFVVSSASISTILSWGLFLRW